MKDQMDLAKFDVRVRDRQIRLGVVTPEAVAAHLEGLKDRADQAEDINFPQPALQPADAQPSSGEARVAPTVLSAHRAAPAAASDAAVTENDDENDEDDEDDDADEVDAEVGNAKADE